MHDHDDEQAATLLALIAKGSERRRSDGRQFWTGFYRHRVERFARLPLAACVSRLLDTCEVPPSSSADVVTFVGALDAPATTGIERALRTRAGLVTALAYQRLKS